VLYESNENRVYYGVAQVPQTPAAFDTAAAAGAASVPDLAPRKAPAAVMPDGVGQGAGAGPPVLGYVFDAPIQMDAPAYQSPLPAQRLLPLPQSTLGDICAPGSVAGFLRAVPRAVCRRPFSSAAALAAACASGGELDLTWLGTASLRQFPPFVGGTTPLVVRGM
jgi:hypothetical protein